jgi:ADP-ribosylglycohydrolase
VDDKIIDRIRGTFLGSACANSLGGSCVGLNRKDVLASLSTACLRDYSPGLSRSFLPDHQPGAVLADTFLALELAESLVANGGEFDAGDLRGRYKRLLECDRFLASGPGSSCLSALRRNVDGGSAVNDGSQEATHDHGAARAYPVGCLPDRVDPVQLATDQAKLFQGDSRVWAAAAVLAHSVSRLVRGDRLDTVDQVRGYVRREFEIAGAIDERFAEWWDDVAPDLDYSRPAHELPYSLVNVSCEVNEAVPTAVGIFLIFRHNFEEAVCAAACAGGDTDTAAAMVGALAGAYHGASAIPKRWLDKLSELDRLEKVAASLVDLW